MPNYLIHFLYDILSIVSYILYHNNRPLISYINKSSKTLKRNKCFLYPNVHNLIFI